MKLYKLNKKIDFILCMLPFFMVASAILITGFYNIEIILSKYYFNVFDFFESNDEIFFLANKLVLIGMTFVVLTITYFKLWKNRFYYIWLGFCGTFAILFFLISYFHSIKKWVKLNYLDNYVFTDHSYIKGLDVYAFVFIVILIFLYFIFVRKIQLSHIIDLCYSAYFCLSIIQIVYFSYDVPILSLAPSKEFLAIELGLYSVGGLIISAILINSNSCKKKLIIWVSSFVVLGSLLRFEHAFLCGYPDSSWMKGYLEYFLIRSDLIFYFVLFLIACYIQNNRLKNGVIKQKK